MTDELRTEAVRRLKEKRRFGENVVGYLGANAVLWTIWALTGHSTDGVPWPVWVSAIWGILLLLDAWKLYAAWPRALRRSPITEEEIEREIKRFRDAA